MWGKTCRSYSDISKCFLNFIQGKIKKFPFSEQPLDLESADILNVLVTMNQNKLFTVNSQPRVNGEKSTHPVYGWGPEKGYVY